MMKQWRRKFQKWTSGILDLPDDLVFDLPRITVIGDMQIYIENHRGVLHFAGDKLKLQLSKGILEVTGSNLTLRTILSEEVFVEGTIDRIEFIKSSEG